MLVDVSSWRKRVWGFFPQVFIAAYPRVRPTAVWAGAGYQLFIICSFLGKNQERFCCRIDLITLALTAMEKMSFNLTSFTSHYLKWISLLFTWIRADYFALKAELRWARLQHSPTKPWFFPVFPGNVTNRYSLFQLLSSLASWSSAENQPFYIS